MNKNKKGCGCLKYIVILLVVICILPGIMESCSTDEPYIDTLTTRPSYDTSTPTDPSQGNADTPKPEFLTGIASGSSLSYYGQLNADEKAVYRALYNELINFRTKVEFSIRTTNVKDTVLRILHGVMYDHPEIFWTDGNAEYTYSRMSSGSDQYKITLEVKNLDYFAYKLSMQKYIDSLNSVADTVVAGANQFSTDYEKSLFVHDYLVSAFDYAEDKLAESEKAIHSPISELIRSSYGCLVEGDPVCAGYAKAYQLIMHKLDIECSYVTGYAGERHAWNCVKLDGEYYLTDVTWDDPLGQTKPVVIRDYYNITDALMGKDHTPDDIFSYPKCDELKLNYYYKNGYVLTAYDFDRASEIITAQKDNDAITLMFESKAELDRAIEDLVTNKKVFKIPAFSSVQRYVWSKNEKLYTLRLIKTA